MKRTIPWYLAVGIVWSVAGLMLGGALFSLGWIFYWLPWQGKLLATVGGMVLWASFYLTPLD